MIKVTYYIGSSDKDTCKKELLDVQFVKVFDELFVNYTLQIAQGVYTMHDTGEMVRENSFIITTFIDDCIDVILKQAIKFNCDTLKEKLNQESILVEICKPETMFL